MFSLPVPTVIGWLQYLVASARTELLRKMQQRRIDREWRVRR
jgi:hypothetical protein